MNIIVACWGAGGQCEGQTGQWCVEHCSSLVSSRWGREMLADLDKSDKQHFLFPGMEG